MVRPLSIYSASHFCFRDYRVLWIVLISSIPSFCFLFLFGECGPISSIRLAGEFRVPLSFCSECSGAPSMFCLLYNPSVWLPLSKAQFLGCIATHRAKAMACLTAEMPGLLGWHQGLRVTVLPLTSWERTVEFSLQKLPSLQIEGSCADSCWMDATTGPDTSAGGKGEACRWVLCCPSQQPTVLQVPNKSEVTCFPINHSSAPQTPHCGNAPLLSPSASRCFGLTVGLPIYILQQKCPSFRFLD